MDKITKALKQARQHRNAFQPSYRNDDRVSDSRWDNSRQNWGAGSSIVTQFMPDALVLEKNRVLNNASREEIIQPYKVLRTRLLQIMKDKDWSSLAVVDPTKDDGKTTVAINLSISIGNGKQHNAVLLDLDLLTPSVHSCYGYEPSCGLDDYYKNETSLKDILVSPNMDGLMFAPSVKALHDSSEFLSTEKSSELISEAKLISPNSIVIVDLPPMLVSDDAISFLPHIDAVLLVVREGKTSKVDIERTQEMLANTNIAGVVINDSVEPATLGYY